MVLPELASVRITAYEESGKFIGHRVLPVIGLCPGYRHVNLRNECGQTMPLATLFLCIVVKDYVPDGLSDFAEALANPIKYQSEQEKRAEQLAVLTEDTEPIPGDDSLCESSSGPAKPSKADSLPRGQQSFTDGGVSGSAGATASSMATGGGFENGAESAGAGGASSALTGSDAVNAAPSQSVASTMSVAVSSTSQPNVSMVVAGDGASGGGAGGGGGGTASSSKSLEAIEADAMRAEPLESILAAKVVREKRQEMEKKLESLRKKHDKEKLRICSSPKSGDSSSSEKKSKFNMGNKLVKRLSSKSM